jgi:hypothetical protein
MVSPNLKLEAKATGSQVTSPQLGQPPLHELLSPPAPCMSPAPFIMSSSQGLHQTAPTGIDNVMIGRLEANEKKN